MKITLPFKIIQSRLYFWNKYILILVLLTSTIVLIFKFDGTMNYVSYATLTLVLFFVVQIEVIRLHNTLTIEEDKILLNKGVLKREHSSASFDKISDFRVYQTFGQHALGYGTLFINTMSEHDLYLSGVRHPHLIRELLVELEQKKTQIKIK
ncbi:MAG: PH domain-containing protein [Candidatus Woesearchaeota archaeon]|nr:PH domain-containing protein [Candidatus Woesearchaeota archaeon]